MMNKLSRSVDGGWKDHALCGCLQRLGLQAQLCKAQLPSRKRHVDTVNMKEDEIQKLKEFQQIWISSAMRQIMMNLECGRALTILTLCARTVRDLPLTNIAEKHAVVASSILEPLQLCTFGRSIARCILLEHMTCNDVYVKCNHGNVRDASCFRKAI